MPTAVSSDTMATSSGGAPVPAPTVTITVQITVPDDVLPMTARRLVDDLRTLTETVVDVSPYVPSQFSEPKSGTPAVPASAAVTGALASGGGGRGARSRGAVPGGKPTLYLETESRTVWRDGVPVHLSRREYDLLSYLCRNPRRVFGREQLLRNVWGYEMVGGERTVDVHIRRLRVKLGGCADGIVTVRGVGYRFDDQAAVALVVEQD